MNKLSTTFGMVLILFSFYGKSQTVQVNPDGTHTIIIDNGSNSIQVNPDGTHTVIIHNGSTSTQINPDGTHSTIIHNGSTSTQINPDGTITPIVRNGNTSNQFNPDGTVTTSVNHGSFSTQTNTGGSVIPEENKYNYNLMPREEASQNDEVQFPYLREELTEEEKVNVRRVIRNVAILHIGFTLTMLGAFLVGSNMN